VVLAESLRTSADPDQADTYRAEVPEKVHRGPLFTPIRIAVAAAIVILVVVAGGLAFHFRGGSQPVSANPQRDIVGSWACNDLTLTFPAPSKMTYKTTPPKGATGGVITSDGTVTSNTGSPLLSNTGHLIGAWKFSMPTYTVKIQGNTMVLTSEGETTYTCTRK
jgi:hypothetical protein